MKTQEERYIEMRNKNQYDIMWFYEHYMEISKDRNMDINKFNAIFQMGNFNAVLDHLDAKFGLDKLFNKDGVLVMCYKNSN
jgi:hypothetical protein